MDKYKKALERARDLMTKQNPPAFDENLIGIVFPELKESEDEQIRKTLRAYIHDFGVPKEYFGDVETSDVLAWLEKQGEQKTAVYGHKFRVGDIVKKKSQPMLDERKIISIDKDCYWCEDKGCMGFAWEDDYELVEQKPTDKIDTKFKVGDWITTTDEEGNVTTKKIIEFGGDKVRLIDTNGFYTLWPKHELNYYHIWTIQDAKDGDVLYSLDSKQPFLYKEKPQFSQARGYCCINKFGEFAVWNTSKCVICADKYIPATKEQRDLLFSKMKEAGYEWDVDKKELKKESEDERIKREILEYINSYANLKDEKIPTEWLEWLEKQGEQTQFDYGHADIPPKDFAPIENKMLNADEVIAWLHDRIQVDEPQIEYNEDGQPLAESFLAHAEARCIAADEVVKQFKKDFGL